MTRIKRLGREDLVHMRVLNALFAETFEDPASYAAAPPSDAYLIARLGREQLFVLVALDGDAVIGGLVAYALEKLEQERSEIYIYDLAVHTDWRRRGIATALIATLRRLARDAGAWVIFVQGDHGDDPALALYDKLGVREEVLHFDIAVHGRT